MGFIHGRTSKQTGKVKTLLELALSRLAVARRPRLARKSISRSDVSQLLTLGHLDRALHRAEQVIEEDNMLEAFNIIELYCNRLIEHAKQFDKPHVVRTFGRQPLGSCLQLGGVASGDLPELLLARTVLANKFAGDFATMAKEGTRVVNPMLVWKLSGNKRNMELKKKVVKEIAVENNIQVVFSEFPEVVEQNGGDYTLHHKLRHEAIYQMDMDESSESDSDHSAPRNEDPCDISTSDGSNNQQPEQKKVIASVRTRR